MYINVEIKLTDEQLKQIQEQTIAAIDDAILEGKLTNIIKETVKGQIKSIVNEEIQTKNYRSLIFEKVQNFLIEREFKNE